VLWGDLGQRFVLVVFVRVFVLGLMPQMEMAGASAGYVSMAPVERYLIPDRDAEIALVMALTREGYLTAVEGTDGFFA
jgi:hypothetical protein